MDFESVVTEIQSLGKPNIESPIMKNDDDAHNFVSDDERVLINVDMLQNIDSYKKGQVPTSFELAGPRDKIYFDPSKLKCALATCGGLCPGLNDIIRSVVLSLYHQYGVRNIYGMQYGLQGFIPKYGYDVIDLTADYVSGILDKGGSVLGSSRGAQDISMVVDCLERMNIGILFMIGGDGTLIAASKIADEITERNLKISVVGIPKTIDNDIHLVARSFGFDTAVDVATQAIKGAHNEALGYPNGIGLIKLMGRHSGFIAATAALAQQDVNIVLIPEAPFDFDGPKGLLEIINQRLLQRQHAVIVVAEGAGQDYINEDHEEHDKSGNIKLKDIGLFVKQKIMDHYKSKKIDISIKYIDPSYIIRSLSANANDSVFCSFLGRDAVHAGMAGKTKMIVGHWNNHFVYLPMEASVGKRKRLEINGKLWRTVLEATGQGSLVN